MLSNADSVHMRTFTPNKYTDSKKKCDIETINELIVIIKKIF